MPELKRFVLHVGRLVPHKGVHDLLDAFALLAGEDPEIGLVIVGHPGNPAYLASLHARHSTLEAAIARRVIFLHDVSDAALRFLYGRASVCASMSEHEGFCVPLLDAIVFDKPIVIRAEPAMLELAGDAAIAVSGASAGEIATALRAALDEPALAKNLSEARKKRLATIRIAADGRCIIDAVAALSRSACAGAHVTR